MSNAVKKILQNRPTTAPDIRERDVKSKIPPTELEAKAKVSRYFLNAMTVNVETLKRYDSDLFSNEFELVDAQDKNALRTRYNLIIKDFRGLSLSYWQKKVVTACFCLIERQGANESRPVIELETKSDLYKEVLEKDKSGRFKGQERRLFDEAVKELQTQKQQVIFRKTERDAKGKTKQRHIMVEAPLIASMIYDLTSDGESKAEDIRDKAKIKLQFNPVIFHGLIDNWRLIPKNISRELREHLNDMGLKKVTPIYEDFILFLHGHAPHLKEIKRTRPVLVQELRIGKEYKKNKKRTTEILFQAYELAKRANYLTDYKLDERGKTAIVDIFNLNSEKFEHLRQKSFTTPATEDIEEAVNA